MRHRYAQCKMSGVERVGIEAFRRVWALMSRAHPCADDLSVYESTENQLAAQRLLLLQASIRQHTSAYVSIRQHTAAAAAGKHTASVARVRVREAISTLI
jgi:hypothetical protein